MADQLAQDVVKDWERLDGDRGTWKSHCQQVALYLDPDRADFTVQRVPGAKRQQWVFDGHATYAHETGAAGLHAMYTSDTLPWFATEPDDDRAAGDPETMAWYQAADAADYAVFSSAEKNFASQGFQVYMDALAYGGGCMGLLDGRNGALFTNRHLKETCFAENEEDRVDQVSRRWEWTAKQAWDQWGPLAGEKVAKAYADGQDNRKFWFHHRVKPRARGKIDPQRADTLNMEFESVYVGEADFNVIAKGGFPDFPYLCPRLSKRSPQDVMGRGRGMTGLDDVKMLQTLARVVARGSEKAIDPPQQMPDDGFLGPLRQGPSDINYFRLGLRPTDRITPIMTGGNIPIGNDFLARMYQKIERWFFNDLFVTPTDPIDPQSSGKGVTATFTDKQTREQRLRMSPINARLNAEWAAPLVLRMRTMNWRKSVLRRFGPGSPYPPPPARLAGQRWHPRFISPLALAQRAAEVGAVDQLMQDQLLARQIDPESLIVIDVEAAMRLKARSLNAPVAVLKSPQALQQEAALKARMAAEQHAAEVAQMQSGAAANFAGAHQAVVAQPGMRAT